MKRRLSHSASSASAYSAMILKRTPNIIDSSELRDADNKMPQALPKNRWSTLKTRSLYGIIMLVGLYCVLISGPLAIIGLIAAVQTLVFKEVISIAHFRSQEKRLPWFRTITWYFLFCTNYFLYGESLALHFKQRIYSDAFLLNMANHHHFISFCLYVFGMMLFVMNLRKGHYKFQFGQLAFTHMALLLVVFQSHFIVRNVFDGLIWFILPVSLVTCNDIAAYFFGCMFGRTPLIKVSPRKTWEGFVGGFVTTVFFGFFFSGYLAKFPSMTCPVYDPFNSPIRSVISCDLDYIFIQRKYTLTPVVSDFIRLFLGRRIKYVWLYPVQIHSLAFSCFASAVAPFGGFFASGFKRAFKMKDFSDSIPGHGGVADRVDCQIVNGLFAYLYCSSFIKNIANASVGALLETAVRGLSPDDQRSLYFKLQDYLVGQGLISDVEHALSL